MSNAILTVDIGGTNIKYALVSEDNQILSRQTRPTPTLGLKDSFYDVFCADLPFLDEVDVIGISSPGLVDQYGNVRSYSAPKLVQMCDTNVSKEVGIRTGKKVAVINDGKAAGLCELKLGAAKDMDSAVIYVIGSGIAGCIVIDGKIYGGIDNFAGEFHFTSYISETTGDVVKAGHLCGNFGLIKAFNKVSDWKASNGADVLDAAQADDPVAKKITDDWIRQIGIHLLSIAASLNPAVICVGGGVTERPFFVDRVREEYFRLQQQHFAGRNFLSTQVVPCKYSNDANLIGAALNARGI